MKANIKSIQVDNHLLAYKEYRLRYECSDSFIDGDIFIKEINLKNIPTEIEFIFNEEKEFIMITKMEYLDI